MSLLENEPTFDEKRKAEFDFFLSILQDFGEQGLRPHQALAQLDAIINKMRGIEGEDRFYWEGVFGPQFTCEKPEHLPKGYTWVTLNDTEKTDD